MRRRLAYAASAAALAATVGVAGEIVPVVNGGAPVALDGVTPGGRELAFRNEIWLDDVLAAAGRGNLLASIRAGACTTDVSQYLQQCVALMVGAGGGVVRVGPGTWPYGQTTTWYSKVSLEGMGEDGQTVFMQLPNTNTTFIKSYNFDGLVGAQSADGVYGVAFSNFRVDMRKDVNPGTSFGLKMYWYASRTHNVVVYNGKGNGIWFEYGSSINPPYTIARANFYEDTTVSHIDAPIAEGDAATKSCAWFANGPTDSRYLACGLAQETTGWAGFLAGPGESGGMHQGSHPFGNFDGINFPASGLPNLNPQWACVWEGYGNIWDNSTAEGGLIGQHLVRGPNTNITSGSQYSYGIGIQIGDVGYPVAGYFIETSVSECQTAVKFANDSGGYIHLIGFTSKAGGRATMMAPSTGTIADVVIGGSVDGEFQQDPLFRTFTAGFSSPQIVLTGRALGAGGYANDAAAAVGGVPVNAIYAKSDGSIAWRRA